MMRRETDRIRILKGKIPSYTPISKPTQNSFQMLVIKQDFPHQLWCHAMVSLNQDAE